MNRLSLTAATLVAVTLHVPHAVADNHTTAKDELIISASPLGDVLQSSQVFSGAQLLLQSAPTLGETLANELGLSSSYFGPAASRPIIRGLSGSRVTMLTDSTSTLDVSDISPDHAVTVEPLLADSIEIIRGPATLLYGSTAAGGVINVRDSRIIEQPLEKPVSGGIELRGDTAAEERAVVGRLDAGRGGFGLHLDGFKRDTDNIEIAGFATADPAERPADEIEGELANSYSESAGYGGGVSWASAERGYLGVSVSHLDSTYGLPGPEEDEGGPAPVPPDPFAGPFLDMDQTRIDARGEYRFTGGFWESVKAAFGTNDYEHSEIEPSGEVATLFENDAWQARFEAVHAPLGDFRGALGFQADDRDLSAIGAEAFVTPTTTEALGIFIVEEADYDWGHLHLGARVESLEHENDTLAKYDDEAWSVSAGAGVGVGLGSEVFVNVSATQRNPAAEELYSNGAHIATRQFEIGLLAAPGATATTEDALNAEVGWRREEGDVRWEITVYAYDIDDYVFQELTGMEIDELPVAQYTQADAEFLGYEAAVSFPVWQNEAWTTDLRLFSDYVKAELQDGRDLPRIPPLRAGANFKIGQAPWIAGLDVIYHASQSDISSFQTSAYTMINASFLYRLEIAETDWELFVRGTNLADENARKSTSFIAAYAPLPGRSYSAGVRARF